MIKQPEYREQIDHWVDAHAGQMLEDLKALVRIPSVKGEAKDGMPFGEMPAKAVSAMQELMEKAGLRTTNYENYCVAGDLDAEGEKALDILTHLDVVPVSDSWTKTRPFEPLIGVTGSMAAEPVMTRGLRLRLCTRSDASGNWGLA